MAILEGTHYRLRRDVVATSLDEDGNAILPDDTPLPPGTEFVIRQDKHPWPRADSPLFYTVELRTPGDIWPEGSSYAVPAGQLDAATEEVR